MLVLVKFLDQYGYKLKYYWLKLFLWISSTPLKVFPKTMNRIQNFPYFVVMINE